MFCYDGVQKIPKPTKPASFLTDEEEEQFSSEMYFKHPQTLLDIFAQLEEQNLFLIQNCQETEEALEDLKVRRRPQEAAAQEEDDEDDEDDGWMEGRQTGIDRSETSMHRHVQPWHCHCR